MARRLRYLLQAVLRPAWKAKYVMDLEGRTRCISERIVAVHIHLGVRGCCLPVES